MTSGHQHRVAPSGASGCAEGPSPSPFVGMSPFPEHRIPSQESGRRGQWGGVGRKE